MVCPVFTYGRFVVMKTLAVALGVGETLAACGDGFTVTRDDLPVSRCLWPAAMRRLATMLVGAADVLVLSHESTAKLEHDEIWKEAGRAFFQQLALHRQQGEVLIEYMPALHHAGYMEEGEAHPATARRLAGAFKRWRLGGVNGLPRSQPRVAV
jgi:hypothetical protein